MQRLLQANISNKGSFEFNPKKDDRVIRAQAAAPQGSLLELLTIIITLDSMHLYVFSMYT